MSWITLLVVLAAVGTLFVSARRAHEVFYTATIATEPVMDAVKALWENGDQEGALTIGKAARPAWLGETLTALLGPGDDSELATDDLLYSLRAQAEALRDMRALARIASFSGVLGATLELLVIMLYGDRHTGGVAVALADAATTQRAFLAITIGMTASTLILYIMMLSYRRARRLVTDCHRATRHLSHIPDAPT